MVLETDHIVKIGITTAVGEEETTITEVVIEIIGPTIGITVGPEIGTVIEMVIDTTIGQIKEGKAVVKGMVIETRTEAGPGIEIEIGGIGVVPEKVPSPEAVPKIGKKQKAE